MKLTSGIITIEIGEAHMTLLWSSARIKELLLAHIRDLPDESNEKHKIQEWIRHNLA